MIDFWELLIVMVYNISYATIENVNEIYLSISYYHENKNDCYIVNM